MMPKIHSTTATSSAEMIANMLTQMEEDFQKSGNSILHRMREVALKLDDLDQNITSLVVDAGLDEEDEEELASNENLDESKETTTSNNNKGSP